MRHWKLECSNEWWTATSDMWTMQLDDDKLLLSDSGSLASYNFTIEQWCFHNKLLSGKYLSSSFVKWIKHLCKILETNALYWKVSWDCILPHTCVYNALWPLMNIIWYKKQTYSWYMWKTSDWKQYTGCLFYHSFSW